MTLPELESHIANKGGGMMALPYRYCVVNMLSLKLDIKNPRSASSTLVDNASKMPEEADVINTF